MNVLAPNVPIDIVRHSRELRHHTIQYTRIHTRRHSWCNEGEEVSFANLHLA